MRRTIFFCVALFVVWAALTQDWTQQAFWLGLLICFASFLPTYLYCVSRRPGLPVFPLFAFTYLWTFGLPLVTNQQAVRAVTPTLYAAVFTVLLFLGLSTATWRFLGLRTLKPCKAVWVIPPKWDNFLWLPIGAALLFNLAMLSGFNDRFGGIFPVLQAAVITSQSLAVFVLSFRWGNRQMPHSQQLLFAACIGLLMIEQTAGLLLISALTIFLIGVIAFTMGRGRVPWLAVGAALFVFSFLHVGKSEMRESYWNSGEDRPLKFWDLPQFYGQWISFSAQEGFGAFFRAKTPQGGAPASLLERSSLLQLFLAEKELCPATVPYMNGETYAIIPELLLPRIFNQDKIWAQEGTSRLNIHFGFQVLEETRITTIGWGLMNEAYANFGLAGVCALGVLLGGFYSFVERFTASAPLMSYRMFAGIIVVSCACQTEYSAGVYVSALFQSIVLLTVVAALVMRRERMTSATPVPTRRPQVGLPARATASNA